MARVISTSKRQTGCRNVTCHVVKSVRLCLLDSDFSKAFGKGGSEGLSDKKSLPADTAPDAGFRFKSDRTLTFAIRYCISEPCIDFYLRVCDKQCS